MSFFNKNVLDVSTLELDFRIIERKNPEKPDD